MDRIMLLDEALINKIAAGEVIERPASVVKELVENSIDAGSKKIFIEIHGREYVRVSDDGSGMSRKDAALSWQRHATSKIHDMAGLFSISTLGFRGEALASIAAVSRASMTTRQEEDPVGTRVTVTPGKDMVVEDIACPSGTTIEVKDLFFNTPARKKYLKGEDVEFEHISDLITKYALIHPEIHFRLSHNGKEVFDAPSTDDALVNLSYVFGRDAKEFLAVKHQSSGISVSGFAAKPTLTKPTRNEQTIYVNKRYIKKNLIISDALNNAYHTFVMVGRYPVAVLDIEVSPDKTDVNVHPQKSEIRMQDEKELYDAVYTAVKTALDTADLIPEPAEELNSRIDDFSEFKARHDYHTAETQQMLVKESEHQSPGIIEPSEQRLDIRIIGIVNKTYILAEAPGCLLLIDQHAAAERILYEDFSKQLREKKVVVQELLSPPVLSLSAKQMSVTVRNAEVLSELGYRTEEFGVNTIKVRTIPVVLGKEFDKSVFLDFIDELADKDKPGSLEEFFHAKVARMACRTAIKAGDEITTPQIRKYVQDLTDKKVLTCPHGRPIIIKVSFYELEKMFKRVV